MLEFLGDGVYRLAEVMADEVPVTAPFLEGGRVQVTVSRYERDPRARAACIRHYGPVCDACRFDFGAAYSGVADGFIHVHHLTPVSARGQRYEIDPVADLRPVCPNCHAVIHYGGGLRTIEEVRALWAGRRH